MFGKERRCGVFAQTDTDIYCGKPYITRQTVENAAYARILLCHAGELSVGAVETVGPHEQKYTEYINPDIGIIECNAGANS